MDELKGMAGKEAQDYILAHLTTLKLTHKDAAANRAELDKWQKRVTLAQNAGKPDLAAAAQKQVDALQAKQTGLDGEIADLKAQIEAMRKDLPRQKARERSIDPDLLEQQLRIALGEDLSAPEATDPLTS
jgi:phage shock protein A